MKRQFHEEKLKELFGYDSFHDTQWSVIEKILLKKRILFIAKTGYGKSLCFQYPAFSGLIDGLTIIFSPLKALMRDQVKMMKANGLPAALITSDVPDEEQLEIYQQIKDEKIKVLYISPERLENQFWIENQRDFKYGMVVVDEAHCISTWGQSFRPDYIKIINLIKLLPKNTPILATTATATKRVQNDIEKQFNSQLEVIRTSLFRSNIHLNVITVASEDEKYYWIKNILPKLPRGGIIYTGTRNAAEIYGNWGEFLGWNCCSYSARVDEDSRKEIEKDFMENKFDFISSTNALGMGIDKDNIRFIIHTQIPQSPVQYFQEIGRAGRDGKNSIAVLLYNPKKDKELPIHFIESSKPKREVYDKVISVTRKSLLKHNEILIETNLGSVTVRTAINDLVSQGILSKNEKSQFFYNKNYEFDYSKIDKYKKEQHEEFGHMLDYISTNKCRMNYLSNYFYDESTKKCGSCDQEIDLRQNNNVLINNSLYPFTYNESDEAKLEDFRENLYPKLKIGYKNKHNMEDGRACYYYGQSRQGGAIKKSKYENGGDFPDYFVKKMIKCFNKYYKEDSLKFDLIVYAPPTVSGNLVKNFSKKVSNSLGINISHGLKKKLTTKPQKEFKNKMAKIKNLKGIYYFDDDISISNKNILVIDDIFDSGSTFEAIAYFLSSKGANIIKPIAITKTTGEDD